MVSKHFFVLLLLLCAVMLLGQQTARADNYKGGLRVGFYKGTCPTAEAIVRSTVASYLAKDITVAAPLLRLHFHDCFVRGCDGSVLLNSTPGNTAEKDAPENKSLDGFYVIDAAKAELEKACPGVVSCADVVALAARDGVFLIKGAYWDVQTGRRDGRVSVASEASANLPLSSFDFIQLKQRFAQKGLNVRDLSVLSGAHAIGNSHCPSFEKRIYNFTGKGDVDPTLDPVYAATLRTLCKPGDTTTTVEMVPGSSTTFDNDYYKLVVARRGLFHSDAALLQDPESGGYVRSFSAFQGDFFRAFGESMVRMGSVGVITGGAGEIRRNCAVVN